MRRLTVVVLLSLVVFAVGCTPGAAPPAGTALTFGEVTATPTRTPAPTRTPMPTPTPIPTPRPLTATLVLEPPSIRPGRTLLAQVRSSVPAGGTLSFGDLTVPLFPGVQAGQQVALIGVSVWTPAGPHEVTVALRDELGRMTTLSATVEVLERNYPVDYVSLLPGRDALLDPQVTQDEWSQIEPILSEVSPERLWEGTFISPTVGRISSAFGAMRSYNGGPPSSYHSGLDISNITGTLVVAPARGRVVLAAALPVRGNSIFLDHGWGVHSAYCHLSEILVQEGQVVEKGEPIGRIGMTGLVSGAHLHWEVRIGLIPVDPREWQTRTFP